MGGGESELYLSWDKPVIVLHREKLKSLKGEHLPWSRLGGFIIEGIDNLKSCVQE